MRLLAFLFCLLSVWVPLRSAAADPSLPPLRDKYHVTEAEKAACSGDAVRLCSDAYPDEDALIVCMRAKRAELSSACVAAFESGLKRRHL